jgi:hypothetical protein
VISVTVDVKSYAPYDTGRPEPGVVVVFDIRGGTPLAVDLEDQWTAVSESGGSFTGVNLAEDWCDYDEQSGQSVSIMNVVFSFITK